jgi:hypothetical protein
MEILKEIKLALWLALEVCLWALDVGRSFVWTVLFYTGQFLLCQLPLMILGLFLVPIGILRPDDSQKAETLVTVDGKTWWLRTFKDKWLKWYDNPVDGTLGDDHMRWGGRDIPFGINHLSFLGQYWWSALRNPLHYFKQFIMCCDIRNCTYEHLIGAKFVRDNLEGRGVQLTRAKNNKGFFDFYRFYLVLKYPFINRAFLIEIGYEFREDHWAKDYTGTEYKNCKGFTWIIHPFKAID